MTLKVIIVLSPFVLWALISLAKYCVSRFTRYRELKLLINSGAKHAVVAENHIEFERQDFVKGTTILLRKYCSTYYCLVTGTWTQQN